MEKLVLIDGNSLINRAFYAMPSLITKDGVPTNAVYGFMNMFIKMLDSVKPTFVGVAFDLKAPTFRHQMYDGYKATRKPMPEDLRPQIPLLKEVLTDMGIAIFEKPGMEADDIIGTLAKHTSVQTYIYTGDRDSFQLVDNETTVCFTKRGITDIDLLTIDNFTEKTGITPLQVIELKSLMGDSSDNIPGVPGIGEKTALSLIQTYGTLDGVYENLDDLKGKMKEKLEAGKDLAYLSKTLATINVDCGVDTDVEKMRFSYPFSAKLKQRFIDLEFKSLYKRDDLFVIEGAPTTDKPVALAKQMICTELSNDLLFFNKQKLAVSITKEGINVFDGETEYTFPIMLDLASEGFGETDILRFLLPIFTGDKTLIIFDKKSLKHTLKDLFDKDLSGFIEDVSIMKYLADFSGRDETLTDVILEYGFDQKSPSNALFNVYNLLKDKLREEKMESLYYDVELPLSDVLFDMEESGFKVDAEALKDLSIKYYDFLTQTEKKIRDLTGEETLNVNSPKQLGVVLFEKLKIGKGKKTKTGYATSAEVLESLEDAHPVVPLILDYRRIQKLRSTYVEGFKYLIEKDTGLIHTSFNQTVTATGRLSSKEPNLQNIPIREDEGRELRKFFVPRDSEHVLIGADYSQIELRLLAAFSDCKDLIKAFNEEKDVHTQTASNVFGVDEALVTPAMRRDAKAVNFGIIYGISEYGLAKNIKTTNAKAREYINSYFAKYPEVKAYMDKNVAFAKENGYVATVLGRKRYIRELSSSNFMTRQFGERVAMNMPLQGSSADIIKLAMLGVSRRLKEEGLKSKLILQVHDELIIDALKSEKEKVRKILTEEMQGALSLSVPLTVELGMGETWFDAK